MWRESESEEEEKSSKDNEDSWPLSLNSTPVQRKKGEQRQEWEKPIGHYCTVHYSTVHKKYLLQ